jgi:hypothetical protein
LIVLKPADTLIEAGRQRKVCSSSKRGWMTLTLNTVTQASTAFCTVVW